METVKINLADFGALFRSDPAKLSDQELLSLDFILHRAWATKRSGKRVSENGKDWDFPEFLDLHALVRQDMSRRAFQHAIKDELDDQTQPLIRSAMEKREHQQGTTVQTLILDKKTFPTEAEARRWVEDHGFRADKVDDNENTFRYRQHDPEDFDPNGFGPGERFRTIRLTEGVQAVIGFVREKSIEDADLSEHPLAWFDRPPAFTLRGVVTQLSEGRLPDSMDIFVGLDFQSMKAANDSIRSVKGKLFLEAGAAYSSDARPDIGDVVEMECDGLTLAKGMDGALTVLASMPQVSSVCGRERPMTVGEAAKAARAAGALHEADAGELTEELLKGIRQAFGSYGGKRFLAHKIASYIPHHRTYVEPFAGGAAVFFAKDPSPKEALNDRDSEIAFMYRFIRDHTVEQRRQLEKKDWVFRKSTWDKVAALKPENDVDRFYRCFYLTRASYGKQRRSYNPANDGRRIDYPGTIERAQARLRNVDISNKDYLEIFKEYDGPDTFFYIDPPYPGEFNLFDFGFKEEEFSRALKNLKGRWIASYTAKRPEAFKGFHVYRVRRKNLMAAGNKDEPEYVTELLASNFPIKPVHLYIEKALDTAPEGMESDAPELLPQLEESGDLEKVRAAFKSPGGKYRLYKKIIRIMPEHKAYVEAFAGGAQVLFHKKRSEVEAINDVNADLIWAYRFIKGMTSEDWEWLKQRSWVISRGHAKRLFEMKPQAPRERFYRFAYLNKATYWGRTDVWEGMRPNGSTGIGARIRLAERLPEIQERLKGVVLHSWDWKDVVKEYDGPGAFFYLDPPYPLHWPKEGGKFGAKFFKEEEMIPVLKAIKGRFLLSYELEKTGLFKGFKTYRIKTLHTGSHQLGGARKEYELLVANYELKPGDHYVEKALGDRTISSAAPSAGMPIPIERT